jgi:serine/threonine protein kinase
MEYCPGMDLQMYLNTQRNGLSFSEEEAKTIVRQLSDALAYIHSESQIHRDVKLENVAVLHVMDENGNPRVKSVKLLDFGLSKYIGEGDQAVSVVGTTAYMAPEIKAIGRGVISTYGPACDCWSFGVLLYMLLFSKPPEFNSNDDVVLPPISNAPIGPNISALRKWNSLSTEAKSLLIQLLKTSPQDRLTMQQTLQHPWLSSH